MGIVRNYRRSRRRKGAGEPITAAVLDPDLLADAADDPLEQASKAQAGRIVHQLLDELSEDKAIVFVLAELEGLTVPEIAKLLSANVNTVYSRLRAGRKEFDDALLRLRSGEAGNSL
jgi:RNA polymerase sigma-70 factor (ECF subfamily)